MDRCSKLAEKIRQQKEAEKCRKYSNVKLEKIDGYIKGLTSTGIPVIFEPIQFGLTEQGQYGAGTLKAFDGNKWKTIFTKGYQSKALKWMSEN